MSDLPKRPWFRFHLLTALVMTVVAGLIVGLNIHPPKPAWMFPVYGWPVYAVAYNQSSLEPWNFRDDSEAFTVMATRDKQVIAEGEPVHEFCFGRWQDVGAQWCARVLSVNVLAGLLILGAAALSSEFLIRHREIRKA